MYGLDLSQTFILSTMFIPPVMVIVFAVSSAVMRLLDRD